MWCWDWPIQGPYTRKGLYTRNEISVYNYISPTLIRFQLTDNFSDRAQSSKAMLNWSGTGSLPLIAGNEELLVPRRNSEVSLKSSI